MSLVVPRHSIQAGQATLQVRRGQGRRRSVVGVPQDLFKAEAADRFARFEDEWRKTLRPSDAEEEALFTRIVCAAWKLDRPARTEPCASGGRSRAKVRCVAEPVSVIGRFRYEGVNSRAFYRARTELELYRREKNAVRQR